VEFPEPSRAEARMKSPSRRPAAKPVPPAPPANPLAESWNQARLGWIALAVLIAIALGRALTTGFVADDIGILDAVSRSGFTRLMTGAVPGLEPATLVRDLGFWWWGSVVGLRATGFHAVGLLLTLVAIACVAAAATRLAGVRAGLVAAAIVVLAPHATVLVGWVPALPDALALAGATAALALMVSGRGWLAALATFVAVAARETLVALPLALAVAAALAPASPSSAEGEPRAGGGVRLLKLVGPSVLAAALAVVARTALHGWPHEAAPPSLAGRLILPPGAAAGLAAAIRALPLLALALLAGAALVVHGGSGTARTTARSGRHALVGWALAACALIPLLIARRTWADVESMTAWAGLALALAVALDRMHPWLTRAVLMALAVVQLAAQHAAPAPSAEPARPVVNLMLLQTQARPIADLNRTLATLCEPLRATPKGFLAGVPPDPMLSVLLGPAARVACRDTTLDLRLLADFRAADAWHAFLVIHGNPATGQVMAEPANALVRARIGEGYLVHARPDVAAACFEAALAERPDDPELAFPLALALTALGRDSAARASWEGARARGAAPAPDTLAARFLFGTSEERLATARVPVTAAVTALTRDPSDSSAARALGHALIDAGAARSGAIAWAVAWGRTGSNRDLVEYAGALEALEEPDLAREAYQRALAAGLPRPLYDRARERLIALGGLQTGTP
jgi:tetratricopeptide (TPR) repeat protein